MYFSHFFQNQNSELDSLEDLLQSTTWSFLTFFFCFSYSRQFGACHRKEHDPCAPKSRLSFCKFCFCLNVNPLELKFAIFVTFVHTSTYILFGACSNLGHSVGKSRTSLLPDMPRPLPFASNLIMRMIGIEYNNDDYLIIMMRIVMITLIMMFTFSCVSPHKD